MRHNKSFNYAPVGAGQPGHGLAAGYRQRGVMFQDRSVLSIEVDEEIQLSSVQESYAPVYVDLAKENYDYLAKWLAWPPHVTTEKDFSEFIARCKKDHESGEAITFGIIFAGKLIGNIAYKFINKDLRKVEIGYWIAEAYQGKGIISRACTRLVEYAFTDLDMSKIEMRVASENKSSRAVCERLGMNLEGVITNAELIQGRILDHAIYGLHREET